MKPLSNDENIRFEIARSRRRVGLTYGMVAGVTFALTSWGWDALLLSGAHAYFPWFMVGIGLVLGALLGGITGWLTARSQSSLLGIVFWLAAACGFAWLTVALPLEINPSIVSRFDPQLGSLLKYGGSENFLFYFGASLAWILPFTLLAGVTQLPITEPAAFATTFFGKVAPFFFCVVLMGMSGSFTDSLINEKFRGAIIALDETIQFVLDNRGNENVDPARSREVHAAALRTVSERMDESRRLFVGSYDETLGEIHVLVNFNGYWVGCDVLYNQPVSCEPVTAE